MGIDHRVPLSDWLLDVIASVFYTAQFSSDLLTCSHDKFGSVFEIYWARVEEMLRVRGSVHPVSPRGRPFLETLHYLLANLGITTST